MSIKLVHIGLGKCGSVFINKIFKEIEKETNIKLINLYDFVKKSKFTLIHIAESTENKINHYQNSTDWIKIEPLDIFIGNDVKNYL